MATRLLEREPELEVLSTLVEDARAGEGGLVTVEGETGVGKTALLAAVAERARAAGLRVLTACGGDLERLMAYGIARQLFEADLQSRPAEERDALLGGAARLAGVALGLCDDEHPAPAGDAEPPLHGFYWLTWNLAARRPLLLSIDDAHEADDASRAWLLYLARRLEGLPVAVVVAVRTGQTAGEELLARLSGRARDALALEGLSRTAVAELLRAGLGEEPGPAFAAACVDATGGNPLMLCELVCDLRRRRVRPLDEHGPAVGVASPQRLRRLVQQRLRALGPDAVAVAEALAVLNGHGDAPAVALLSELPAERVWPAVDELRAAGIVGSGLRFAHPILRTAVHDGVADGRRGLLHARAAHALDRLGAPPEAVAAHLRRAAPAGDSWAVTQLRGTAAEALRRGAPAGAVAALERALAEGPDQAQRLGVLAELGVAEALLGLPAAVAHLEEVAQRTSAGPARAEAASRLARVLLLRGDRRGLAVLDEVLSALERTGEHAGELGLRLLAEFAAGARIDSEWARRAAARLDALPEPRGATPGERAVLACLASEATAGGHSAARAAELAQRALAGGHLLEDEGPDSPVVLLACATLVWADRPRAAAPVLDELIHLARCRGSRLALAHALAWRAELHLRTGEVAETEKDASLALDLLGEDAATSIAGPLARAWLVLAAVERDRLEDALAALGPLAAADLPPSPPLAPMAHARGVVRGLRHDQQGAAADFRLAGEALLAAGVTGPSVIPWLPRLAMTHLQLGDRDRAASLARDAVTRAAGFGAPGPSAGALRALAATAAPDEGLDLLRAALEQAERCENALERARAACALGAALRRRGARRQCRAPLRDALDLATDAGCLRVARQAHEELMASGARPRRLRLTGRDALTPSERRTAQLAGEGLSNRDIAQALFVTVKTVETQLSSAYSKLGITSRRELAKALAAPAGPSPATERAGTAPGSLVLQRLEHVQP